MNLKFWEKKKTSYIFPIPTYLDPKENGGFDKIDPKDCDGHRYVWVDWDSEPHPRFEKGVDKGVCIKCG